MRRLRHSRVFRPCFPENRNVRVGVLPERQEIVVSAFRLHGIAREHESSRQLQARHRVHGIDEHDAAMIENPLELADGFGGLTCGEVRQSANIDGIQAAETSDEADTPKSEIVASSLRAASSISRRWRAIRQPAFGTESPSG